MKKIQIVVASLMMLFGIAGTSLTLAAPTVAAAGTACTSSFLTFPAWYRGLTNPDCTVKSPSDTSLKGGLSEFIWTIVLNVIEIVLQLIAYAAAVMILYGGFRFLTSAGDANGVSLGKKIITNAIIGLVISIASIAIVNLIFGIIK